jgi:hypothetical protein
MDQVADISMSMLKGLTNIMVVSRLKQEISHLVRTSQVSSNLQLVRLHHHLRAG